MARPVHQAPPCPRQPTTQMEMRRHPERPRAPAVRPDQGPCPSPRGWPPWPPWLPRSPGPPCGPRSEQAQTVRRTQMPWLRRRTRRRCRCGIADSRRT